MLGCYGIHCHAVIIKNIWLSVQKQRKKICHTCDKDSTSVPSHKSKIYTRAKSKKKTQPEKRRHKCGSDCVVITDDVVSFKDSQLPLQVLLGLGVSQNLKQKIINEEYIDFYQLLQDNPTESLTINFTQNREGQTVAIAPGKSKDKKITNFKTWLKAFKIYVAIYSPSHPDKTPGLMKYASNMRELNDTYGSAAWAYYDKAFRKWRQYNTTFPWGGPLLGVLRQSYGSRHDK